MIDTIDLMKLRVLDETRKNRIYRCYEITRENNISMKYFSR